MKWVGENPWEENHTSTTEAKHRGWRQCRHARIQRLTRLGQHTNVWARLGLQVGYGVSGPGSGGLTRLCWGIGYATRIKSGGWISVRKPCSDWGYICCLSTLYIYKNQHSLAWCLTYIIPTYRRLTEEDSCEFMGNMGYRLTLLHKGRETERETHTHRNKEVYSSQCWLSSILWGVVHSLRKI